MNESSKSQTRKSNKEIKKQPKEKSKDIKIESIKNKLINECTKILYSDTTTTEKIREDFYNLPWTKFLKKKYKDTEKLKTCKFLKITSPNDKKDAIDQVNKLIEVLKGSKDPSAFNTKWKCYKLGDQNKCQRLEKGVHVGRDVEKAKKACTVTRAGYIDPYLKCELSKNTEVDDNNNFTTNKKITVDNYDDYLYYLINFNVSGIEQLDDTGENVIDSYVKKKKTWYKKKKEGDKKDKPLQEKSKVYLNILNIS